MSERMYYSREAEIQAQRDRFILAVVVALLGLGMGAVLALLFAPQAGEQTRRQLGEQVETAASQGRDAAQRASRDIRDNVQKIRDNVEDRVAHR